MNGKVVDLLLFSHHFLLFNLEQVRFYLYQLWFDIRYPVVLPFLCFSLEFHVKIGKTFACKKQIHFNTGVETLWFKICQRVRQWLGDRQETAQSVQKKRPPPPHRGSHAVFGIQTGIVDYQGFVARGWDFYHCIL